MSAQPDANAIRLPVTRLVVAAAASCLVAGGLMSAIGGVMAGTVGATASALGAATVAAASVVALLAIRPWKARDLQRWPFVWMAGSFLRMLGTLAGGILVYSATQSGPLWLGLTIGLSYMVTLFAETRVYAGHMRPYFPTSTPPSE